MFLATTARLAVFLFGLFLALVILEIEKAVTSLLAGAGVIGLVLGLAFKEIASNYLAGIILAFREPFAIGDIIDSNSVFGTVRDINLRTIVVETFFGQEVHIPNAEVLNKAITNFSSSGNRRLEIEVGVHYKTDLERAERLVDDVIKKKDYVLRDKTTEVVFHKFADSSINMLVRFWIDYPDAPSFYRAQGDAIKTIKAEFDRAGITIPFPIRTVEMERS